MNRTKTNPLVIAKAKATAVRYIEIVVDNNAVEAVREDLVLRDGESVYYELLDTLTELFPLLPISEDEQSTIANEALIVLKTIFGN